MNIVLFFLMLLLGNFLEASLLDNLQKGKAGDYIVTAQGRNFTLLHLYDKKEGILTIEEITAPQTALKQGPGVWKKWVSEKAPGHTAWVLYGIDLKNGKIAFSYSVPRETFLPIGHANSFLTTLLNLQLHPIPPAKRKKLGASFKLWQPKMVVEGVTIPGVEFDAWRTLWPKDETDLSHKTIDVYIPHESEKYPSYFPYWLEISGLIGSAKVRIIDSGTGMISPAKINPEKQQIK